MWQTNRGCTPRVNGHLESCAGPSRALAEQVSGNIGAEAILLQVLLSLCNGKQSFRDDGVGVLLHSANGAVAIPCDQMSRRFKREPAPNTQQLVNAGAGPRGARARVVRA